MDPLDLADFGLDGPVIAHRRGHQEHVSLMEVRGDRVLHIPSGAHHHP